MCLINSRYYTGLRMIKLSMFDAFNCRGGCLRILVVVRLKISFSLKIPLWISPYYCSALMDLILLHFS